VGVEGLRAVPQRGPGTEPLVGGSVPQRSPGTEPLVGGSGGEAPRSWKLFVA